MDLGFVHRPILAALLWAGLTMNLQPALNLGIFFELLWLDLFPAGTFIPPHALFSLTATLTLLACLPEADMRLVTFVIVCVLPLAHLGAWAEQRYRQRQNLSYNALLVWNRKSAAPYIPQRLIHRAVLEGTLLYMLLFAVCTAPLLVVIKTVRPWIEGGPQPAWPALWLCACVGAVLALRLRKAHALALVALVLGVLGTM